VGTESEELSHGRETASTTQSTLRVVVMSSNKDPNAKTIRQMFYRNDLHVYINDKLFFGERILYCKSPFTRPLRLSDRSQRHLGEPVLMYEHHCPSPKSLQLFLSTEGIFKFFGRFNCLGLVVEEIV